MPGQAPVLLSKPTELPCGRDHACYPLSPRTPVANNKRKYDHWSQNYVADGKAESLERIPQNWKNVIQPVFLSGLVRKNHENSSGHSETLGRI